MNSKNILQCIKISLVVASSGLFISLCFAFVIFGKGMQFILPFIVTLVYFVIYALLYKLEFIRRSRLLKYIIPVVFTLVGMIIF